MTIYKNARGELVITKAHFILPMKIAKKRHAKKYPADEFTEHKTKKNLGHEKHDKDEGDGCYFYSLNWYYDMVSRNWEADSDVVETLPQFEEDEITEAIGRYIETHEDEVVATPNDYERQTPRQEVFGEDIMTDEDLKAHKAKKEADRDAMVGTR